MAKQEKARSNLSIRVESSIKRGLTQLAKQDNRSVSAYARKVLKKHVEDAGGKDD